MKRSQYSYFFELDREYVGYSYLSDSFVSFPIAKKERVDEILEYPDSIVTNYDANVYNELCDSKCLINDGFNEYECLMRWHRQSIYNDDIMMLTIVPTMACNCRCSYCYELHTKGKMTAEVIRNLKTMILGEIKVLRHLRIGWFGGEPLMYSGIIDDISGFCLDLCAKEGVEYHAGITTNGYLLDDRNARMLNACGINTVHITLDGSRETHDKRRILVSGGPTFYRIYENIVGYLDADEKNEVYLRIHVTENAGPKDIRGIVETLKLFDRGYRKRIKAYPHVLFSSCSELMSVEGSDNCVTAANDDNSYDEKALAVTDSVFETLIELGFRFAVNANRGLMAACPSETKNYWVVRPDGYLTKCTVGIERERAIGRLTGAGVEIYSERLDKTVEKEFSSHLYEYCHDCRYLPLCWQKCTFRHYMNPDWHKNAKVLSCKNKLDWGMKRQLNEIKYRYLDGRNESANGLSHPTALRVEEK